MWGILYQGESIYIYCIYYQSNFNNNNNNNYSIFYVFKEVSYAQWGLIYLIKKNSKTKDYSEILLQFKTAILYCNIF